MEYVYCVATLPIRQIRSCVFTTRYISGSLHRSLTRPQVPCGPIPPSLLHLKKMKRFSTTHSTLNVSLTKRFYAFAIVQIIPTTEILHNIYLCILMCVDPLNPEYGFAGRHWYIAVCSMPTINCLDPPWPHHNSKVPWCFFHRDFSSAIFLLPTSRSGGEPLALQRRSPEFSQKARLENIVTDCAVIQGIIILIWPK